MDAVNERSGTGVRRGLAGPGAQTPECLVLDALPHLLWVGDATGRALQVNAAWCDYLGLPDLGAQGADWTDWIHPQDRALALAQWRRGQSEGAHFQQPYRLRHHSGAHCWFLVIARAQRRADNTITQWLVSFTDIHQRALDELALNESARAQHKMLDVSVDCIKIIRTDGTVSHMNRSGCVALGVPLDETRFGMKWLDLLPRAVRQRGQRALRLARRGRNARFAGLSQIPGSKPHHWDNILTPIKDEHGQTTGILCVSRDITLQREAEKRLRMAGEIDALTGLENRRSFKARLKRLTLRHRGDGQCVGLLMIDLDHFKHVNDTLGHAAGDHLLRVLSRRLATCLPPHGFVARLGGDEFAFLVSDIQSRAELLTAARTVHQQIEAPITYQGRVVNGGMSIGCALYPHDAQDAQGLMQRADTALNDLKADGRGGVRIFDDTMMRAAERTASQLARARQLVRDRGLTPHYQAKNRLDDGHIVGFEALLRWHCPERGWQDPCTVEDAFTDYALATRISAEMQDKVFGDMAQWLAAGLPVQPVSINAAPVEFLRDDFAEQLLRRVEQHRIPTHLLEIEVTEHSLGTRGSDHVVRALKALKAAGIRVALDDFGAGQSSFANLRDYPVDCIKIDADFVRRMQDDPAIMAIITAICQLGPALSMDVVAEGVETVAQRDRLYAAGCRIGQGYLYSVALGAERVAGMLRGLPTSG